MFINCPIHGEQSESLLNGLCKACRDKKIYDQEQSLYENMIINKKRDSGIMERYLKVFIENYKITNQKQEELIKILINYNYDKDIVLLGKTGTGKTHLACSLIDKAIRKNISCFYITYYNLAKLQIKNSYKFDVMVNSKFLVIDEYGMSESDYKSNLLAEIWNDRNGNNKITMLLSNAHPEDIKPAIDKNEKPISVSHALYSRMRHNSIYYACNWEDYRMKGK